MQLNVQCKSTSMTSMQRNVQFNSTFNTMQQPLHHCRFSLSRSENFFGIVVARCVKTIDCDGTHCASSAQWGVRRLSSSTSLQSKGRKSRARRIGVGVTASFARAKRDAVTECRPSDCMLENVGSRPEGPVDPRPEGPRP